MNFSSTKSRIAVATLMLTLCANASAVDTPQAEILHWWSSKGEAAALNIFIEAFKSRGGHFYDSKKDDQVASREEAIERLGKGYPPTLTQWNAGRDVREFYDFGLTSAITEPKIVEKLTESLPRAILDTVMYKDEIVALPINIHSENWMWYSNELIDYQASMISNNWKGLIDHGKELAKKDIPLLAVGDQSWQVRILFSSLFLGISRDLYKDVYLKRDPSAIDSAEFKQVLTTYTELAKLSKSFGDGNWNTQVKAVSDNQAGATFMGDWAKGEFNTLGKSAGSDFGCALTAGSDPSLLLVVDTFILGKVTDSLEKKGQALMLDIISDPETNQKFNALKGSVSPFYKPSADELDPCSAQVYKTLAKDESVIPPYATYEDGGLLHKLDAVVFDLWKAANTDTDIDTMINTSIELFKENILESISGDNPSIANIDE